MVSFEELRKTWRIKKEILERFARALNCEIIEHRDDWYIIVDIVELGDSSLPRNVMYTSVGTNFPEAYDELLTIVMCSRGWSTVEEIEVWLDLNSR